MNKLTFLAPRPEVRPPRSYPKTPAQKALAARVGKFAQHGLEKLSAENFPDVKDFLHMNVTRRVAAEIAAHGICPRTDAHGNIFIPELTRTPVGEKDVMLYISVEDLLHPDEKNAAVYISPETGNIYAAYVPPRCVATDAASYEELKPLIEKALEKKAEKADADAWADLVKFVDTLAVDDVAVSAAAAQEPLHAVNVAPLPVRMQ